MENLNKVLVIGQLGELVKKICELELAIEENPKNETSLLSLAAYREVLEAWPLDAHENFCLSDIFMEFKLAHMRLVMASKDFEASVNSRNHLRLGVDAAVYLLSKNTLKDKMLFLNNLGRYIGNVPIINLPETKEQSNVESPFFP